MNHYEYQSMIDEQKRIVKKVNHEAWKYASGYTYRKLAFIKFIFSIFGGDICR
ncbi:hypothetical protein KHA96_17170 [Bacillus sp. FJAT-49711]|uniref:hypothetical protein n=1 Tax=Bacillus sp. FJAT-49711 TaxID=2833585 RepID=UPI001BC9D169|nr:hypothetical protein [Bacillus sp. FJAT-49711]MBS4220046.1 hypothetical protein [Bacillus sp. FJAT-49711]